MNMPDNLRKAIDTLLSGYESAELLTRAAALSQRYRMRQEENPPSYGPAVERSRRPIGPVMRFIHDRTDASAYALARMPATFGAVSQALETALAAMEAPTFDTMLDVGAGTGAASWAADALLGLTKITCVEISPDMRKTGETLAQQGSEALQNACWLAADITEGPFTNKNDEGLNQADLVTAAYLLNELDEAKRLSSVMRLWALTGQVLLLVEPGTKDGFQNLRAARNRLTAEGAYILAPCPHEGPCLLPDSDWCHFSARIPRSRIHKRAKNGDAPYEDEKFSYLALSRTPAACRGVRVLRHPKHLKGYVSLSLCAETGLQTKTITRRDDTIFTQARKLQWGDSFTGMSPAETEDSHATR